MERPSLININRFNIIKNRSIISYMSRSWIFVVVIECLTMMPKSQGYQTWQKPISFKHNKKSFYMVVQILIDLCISESVQSIFLSTEFISKSQDSSVKIAKTIFTKFSNSSILKYDKILITLLTKLSFKYLFLKKINVHTQYFNKHASLSLLF